MCVFDGTNFVDVIAARVPTLHGVGVDYLEVGVEDYSSAALLREIFVFILGVHVILAERTASVVEFGTI